MNDLVNMFLSLITQFVIPTSPTVRNFDAFFPGAPEAQGAAFKFDFSDYDFDGDGKPDGFTGCTCPVGCAPAVSACPSQAPISDLKPVGFRIWQQKAPGQYEPIMAGFCDFLPIPDDPNTPQNEENPGKGTIRFARTDTTDAASPGMATSIERLLAAVIYDHRDPASPLNQHTEIFILNDITTDTGVVVLTQGSHGLANQIAKTDPAGASYLEKTVKALHRGIDNLPSDGPGEKDSFQAYTGRFRDDADFWSGSFVEQTSDPGSTPSSIPTTCARISTGEPVLSEICLDLNIDTSNEDVTKGQTLSAVTESDVLLPADFPATPTF